MRYIKAFDIYKLSENTYKDIMVGQWIFAGDISNKGRFLGVKKSGTVVVAWHNNAKQQKDYAGYIAALLAYSKG